MGKGFNVTETVFTTLEPKRVLRFADECLLDIRLVESRLSESGKETEKWIYEYEVKGESGRIGKFLIRVRSVEHAS